MYKIANTISNVKLKLQSTFPKEEKHSHAVSYLLEENCAVILKILSIRFFQVLFLLLLALPALNVLKIIVTNVHAESEKSQTTSKIDIAKDSFVWVEKKCSNEASCTNGVLSNDSEGNFLALTVKGTGTELNGYWKKALTWRDLQVPSGAAVSGVDISLLGNAMTPKNSSLKAELIDIETGESILLQDTAEEINDFVIGQWMEVNASGTLPVLDTASKQDKAFELRVHVNVVNEGDLQVQQFGIKDIEFKIKHEQTIQAAETSKEHKTAKIKPTSKNNFNSSEEIILELENADDSNLRVKLLDRNGKEVQNAKMQVVLTSVPDVVFPQVLKIQPPHEFIPGEYTVQLTDLDNNTTSEQDFTWGVLAVNTNKSIYKPGEKAKLAYAVLDEKGNMVCDASVTLRITNEELKINDELSTKNGRIKVNPECTLKDYTMVPDYESEYVVGDEGIYTMTLTSETRNGSFTIEDSFEVYNFMPFVVERISATRIYPLKVYPVQINVTAINDYKGIIKEIVPKSFVINKLNGAQAFSSIKESDGTKQLLWNVDIKQGETVSLGYTYDAPDISPYFYTLGPLQINTGTDSVFRESRNWQIASDATITISGNVYSDESSTVWNGCNHTTPSNNISISVNGGTKTSTSCNSSTGAFSTTIDVTAANDVVTVFIDGHSDKGVLYTKSNDSTSNISGISLLKGKVWIQSESSATVTNSNINSYDKSAQDTDIPVASDGTNITIDVGYELHINSGDTFAPGGNVTIGGSYHNLGTFTAGTGTVTFNSTSTGNTVTGTLNGTSAFYKIAFSAAGGGWTITDPIRVSAANATDTFVIGNGTVTLGDGNGDNLELAGKMTVAATANQTGTFQTAVLSNGNSIIIDVNDNASTPSCANCMITVGATSGTGQGTAILNKNSITRLNPRSAATASDSGIVVESRGYLQVLGTQDHTGTFNGTVNETTLTDSTKSFTSTDIGKTIRLTSGLAFGKLYNITAQTSTALTIADTSTADFTVVSIPISTGPTRKICVGASTITTTRQYVGRYINDKTGTTGLLQIAYSTNDDAACSGTDDSLTLYNEPDAFNIAVSDSFDITDGIKQNDTYEIIDYAHITAESGTACTSTIAEAGEGYIDANSGHELLIRYSNICNLGRNSFGRYGIESTANNDNANEGLTIEYSTIDTLYRGVFATTGNKNIVTGNSFTGNSVSILSFNGSSTRATVTYNNIFNNPSTVPVFTGDYATLENNYISGNGSNGVNIGTKSSVKFNKLFNNTGSGINYTNVSGSNIEGNHSFGNGSMGITSGSNSDNNLIYDNLFYANAGTGIYFNSGDNSIVGQNEIFDNLTNGVFTTNTDNLTLFNNSIYSNKQRGYRADGTSGGGESTNILFLNGSFGVGGSNTNADITSVGTGAHTIEMLNTSLTSATEIESLTNTGAYLISKNHDGTSGSTKIWGEYSVRDEITETPQSESIEKFNYLESTWGKSVTAHGYSGTGTEDTNLDYDISTANLSGGPYGYRLVTKTAGNGTTAVFDVFRNGTDVGDATAGTLFTDSNGSVNVKFKIDGGGTSYAVGDTYTFVAFDSSNDTNTVKTTTVQQDGDTITVGSGKTLEFTGKNDGTANSTLSAATGTFDLTVNGTLSGSYNTITVNGNVLGTGTVSFSSGSTFEQKVSAAKTFGTTSGTNSWSFHNLKFNNSHASTAYTISPNAGTGHIICNNAFTIGDSGTANITFDNNTANDRVFDINGSVNIGSRGIFVNSTTEPIDVGGNFTNSGTFTANGSTIEFDSNSSGNTIQSTTFENVSFTGSGSWTINTSTQFNGDFTMSNGTLNQGANINLTFLGDVTLNNGSIFNKASGTGKFIMDGPDGTQVFRDNHTTKVNLGNVQVGLSPGTTTLGTDMSATSITIPTTDTFNTKGYDVTITDYLDCQGTCALNLTDTAPNNEGDGTTITLGGNWTMSSSATFTPATSTIIFNDNSKTSVITGSTIFNNLTSTTAGKTIKFDDNDSMTFTINGILTLNGTYGNHINIESDSSGNQWTLNHQGTESVTYTSVKDSGCSTSPASTEITDVNGTDSGNNGTCWTFTVSGSNPDPPADLTQKKVTGGTTLVVGNWTNETQVQFTATASDSDSGQQVSLCIEKDILNTAFSNTEDSCGTLAAQGTVVLTINSLTDATQYHWQARIKDAGGNYSAWISFSGNAETESDFGVDTTAPVTTSSNIYDGASNGVDAEQNGDGSLTELSANWAGFNNNVSGLQKYEYSIGITAGGTSVLNWTDAATSTNIEATGLSLQTGQVYYFNVRAVDNAGNTSAVVTSNGQYVTPTLTFSLSSGAVTFSNLNSSNNYSDTENITMSTSTNAFNGYVVKAHRTSQLTNIQTGTTIPDFSGGSYASPSLWTINGTSCGSGECGFGYTSSDPTIGGYDKFEGGSKFAPFSSSGPGDIVADHTEQVVGTAIANETHTITNKVAVSDTQAAGTYTTTVSYTIVPQY